MRWPELRERCRVEEDEAVLALDKPAGISVTGERHDTDLVRLAAEHGETLYPVHRIDKVTSGLVLLAKDLTAHGQLTRQFNKRTAAKTYLAVTATTGLPDRGIVDLPLSVGRKNRVRIAAPREAITRIGDTWTVDERDLLAGKNYPSRTEFTTALRTDTHTLLVVRPLTGRRHQIRVHLAWIGHPLAGDPLFDKSAAYPRTHLHSWRLRLDAPWRTPAELALEAPPGPDFWTVGDGAIAADPSAVLAAIAA
ncbi:RNA pseudouridine synthase [Nocardia sp. CDC159]|uniref:RNA pseudouridylate synthase n=1 Tax=Nocardia pulmonis TaxID=2951408 RepID=A0A9X2E3Q9_9NOCA|nr:MULTISPECIES: RNA pseudouridine synthase [Nocardia]MCM6773090.1 RNA pseudouridine synthase [Nocardia pulmonis]MCM6785607.1 RNA pseudouridine synthase [Nocardia sp. CDC159]